MHERAKRWYEQIPDLNQALDTLMGFREDLMSVVAEGMSQLAETRFELDKEVQQATSLGAEKIMGLHKSKKRQRFYDANPFLHKAMNSLYILSDEARQEVSGYARTLTSLVEQYIEYCHEIGHEARADEVRLITRVFVQHGQSEAEQFLVSLKNRQHKKNQRYIQMVAQTIRDDNQGMRLQDYGTKRPKSFFTQSRSKTE